MAALPDDVRDFLGMGNGEGATATVREAGAPSFAGATDDFTDQTKMERRARFRASAEMLFGMDVSKLDEDGAWGLYQSAVKGMFGVEDEDGSVAFGRRASKDPRANIEMLRKFVKGDYTLIEDPEYTKWRQMDEETKFRHALESETAGNKLRSYMKGERGAGFWENVRGGAAMSVPGLPAGAMLAAQPEEVRGQNEANALESARRSNYETLTDEEKVKYRADVIGDYEEKLSRRQTLATFLQFAHGLSDRAGYLLAKSFNDGAIDPNVEGLVKPDGDTEERDRVYAAFSLMRGDQKKGRILGVQTDFTDDTVANRLQLGLYGFQQSVVGLVTAPGEMVRDFGMWGLAKAGIDISRLTAADIAMFRYSHAIMDEAERKEFFKGWDANVRAEQAMKQSLPEADGIFGEAFQGLAENLHWFIPYYLLIGKGGKMVNAARGFKEGENALKGWKKVFQPLKDLKVTLTPMRLGGDLKEQKAVAETIKAVAEADVAATKAAYTLDINGVKKLGEYGSSLVARQMAAVESYTQRLKSIDADLKAAKWWKDAAGTGMWAAGEASAFSAFASEYIANADAAGISREESVLTAAAIGLINAKIEQLYVPGLESSLSPAQIKSLTFAAMAQAIKTDGAAGFRKWLANRVSKGVTEGVKVTLTEGAVEEPLQQMAIEHGKAFDKLCGELRENGQATLANEAKALWDSFARTLPNDYATFIDTAADMVPSSLGFGVTTIGNMTRRQHIHNAMTRHANRRAGSTSTMMTAQTMEELQGATDYDAGLVDVIQQAVNVRAAVEKHWQGEEDGGEAKNPHRFEEAITAARRAWRDPQTGDAVQEIADAAGVDVKTAEVLAQYLQTEAEAAAFSPQARAWTSLNMSLADIDEATIKTVLPGYVEGSFASDPENGIYSGRVRMDDGTEKTIAYRVGDLSAELVAEAQNMAKADSSFGKSFDARHAELGDGVTWASLSDAQRYAEAIRSQASVNGFSTGKSGVFELTDSKGEKVRVNADDIIYLANGRIGDIGYGPAATQGTVRHETFHSLWRFVRGTLSDADVQQLAKTLGIDVTKDGWEVELDEKMAHEMERYASGHYVSHAVSSRFDKMLDSWAGKIINFFGQFGPSDEVTDPKTGKPYQLKGLYDSILRGELGSGALGVELRKVPQRPAAGGPQSSAAAQSTMPVEVTDADRAAQEAEAQAAADESEKAEEKAAQPQSPKTQGQNATVDESGATAPKVVHTAENPADAATPNQVYYRVGLPNSPVKLVGRLEVRDVDTGIITSTDADYHDRGNQNRDDRSEESRALVEKIGANPDPLQIGTVQPIASNGIIWMLPNGDVIIGNHRVNGVRLGYAKGTTAELEKFVREDAGKRGIEIGADVKKPLMVFVLERIESPDGKADVHEVVRLANESQNRGFNIREQAGNDAKILTDNNLLPRMEFRADGRIDETKSGDAIGKFRQESGAQGLIAEDGSLTEEGQTRIQNAALAVLLGGEGSSRQSQGGGGNNALLNKIMTNAGRLDMQTELRALMKMTPELMALSEAKPAYDLRGPIAEALQLFTEWRDRDESARVEKGKTRHDWRETAKDGHRLRGMSWETFMSQGDMFRAPSDEAKILGDLFARAEAERSFDREDVESAAGKKRVIDLISDYLTDYIANARAVNTETDDMFGGSPASRADVLAAQRATGGEDGGPRFSINPNLRADIDAALAKDARGHYTLSGSRAIQFSEPSRIMRFLGIDTGNIFTVADVVQKMEYKHKLTSEEIADLPRYYDDPAAVFVNIDGKGANVLLTELKAVATDGATGKPVMVLLRPSKRGDGGYIASAYPRDVLKEQAYVDWIGKLKYLNENKIAGLGLEVGTVSRLKPQASGDDVKTAEDFSKWSTARIIPQTGAPAQGGRYSISGIYTGSSADYANRSRQGGVDDGPSVKKIGTGEGSQVYGWGLYGSTVRGVAEGYATPNHLTAEGLAASALWQFEGKRNEAIKRLQGYIDKGGLSHRDFTPEEKERTQKAIQILKDHKEPNRNLYEQTFFTNRAPGDESHLLKWYDAISDANWDRVIAQAEKEGLREKLKGAWWLRFNGDLEHFITDNGNSGDAIYESLSRLLGSPQAASEFLYRAGIDGVKYPVDSYGGKGVKDGDEAGWNYVAFSDEHIRVDHKWTDGQMRYSIAVTPEVRKATTVDASDMTREKADAALRALAGRDLKNDETGIVAQVNSVQRRKILSGVAVQKSADNGFSAGEHNAAASIIEKLWKHASLGKVDGDKNGDPFVKSIKRFVSPVRLGDKDAYAYLTVKESNERGHRIYSIELEKLEALARKLGAQSPAAQSASVPEGTPRSIAQTGAPAQGGRYSVSKDLQDAMRKREIMQSIPVEGKVQPWPENFPKVMLQTTLASVKQKWPELHAKAKSGDREAALELVRNILGEEPADGKRNPKWEKLRALAAEHPNAIVAYVHAEEATGRNKIPMMYAAMIEKIAGLRNEPRIVQTVRAHHTGANAVERMTRRAAFDGPVVNGAEYILVDDHVTQGGTLNELRKYIQSHGGKVVAITTLTASQFSDTIRISSQAIEALYRKFGNDLDEKIKEAGIANGVAELTQSQARELLKLRADTLRDRLAQARLNRLDELGAQAVRYSTESRVVSGATDWLPGLKQYLKPDGTFTETGTRWAKARQFQRPIGQELNALIDECLIAGELSPEDTAATLERLIAAVEATDEIRNGVLPNFRRDSAKDDPALTVVGPDGKRRFNEERLAIQYRIYDQLMADTITGGNNEALETRKDGTAKETEIIVRANEGRPELPPIPLKNPSYETAKEFRIDIIVGPPAAGKSSVFANALSVFYRSRVLDCDAVKKMLPGFNDGNGASYVHEESSQINKRMIRDIQHRAEGDPRRGENVVLPVLGDDAEGLRRKIADWHAAGYTVYLHNNRVPILHAFGRAVIRTLATGRWINPDVIKACQDNPTRAYKEVKGDADYYDQFSNDVTYGESPVWEDGNYTDRAYGEVRRLDESAVRQAGGPGLRSAYPRGMDGRLGRNLSPASVDGQYILPGMENAAMFSTEAPRSNLVYPQLRSMSDDELLAAAVATRIALGKSDKVSDRSVKVKTVQNLMRRLHPDWDATKIGVESLRVMSGAQKFAKRIRDDIDRGVSDSLVLRHLPESMREQFGREMRQETREGARLGAFGARANAAIEERQARVIEDAVRVQTGLDASVIENAFGINLSETIMHLDENPLTENDDPPSAGSGEEGAESADASAEEEEMPAAIDAKVKAVVDDIVGASGQQAGADERNRQERRAAAGREEERETGAEDEEGSGEASPSFADGDALAEAAAKESLNLKNPRHLARFVAELARRQWIKEHGLAQNADVWRDLVAVQFLRKTAQSVYAKLCRDLVYSRSRETAMQRIAKLDNVPTVAGLLSEMEFVGALVNAQRIRDTQKQLCEKLDLFLRQNFGAQGRFKPDKEEGKRKVSAEAELRARYMRHAMWLTPDAAADEARQLQETLDALSVDFKEAGRDRDQSREFVETIRKLNVLREFGALRYKPLGEIEAAAQWWEDFARGESDDIVREMSDRDIRTKKAAHLLAVAFADPKRTTIREGGKADALNRFITGHMGFISLLQDCMRHASDADAAAVKDIVDYISREIQKSGDRSEAEKRRHNDAFHSAVEGIYGKGFNAVMKDMMAPDERFSKYMGVVGGKRVTPTKGRALQLLVSLLQEGRKVQVEDEDNPGQTKTVWEGGYHDNIVKHHREGQAAEIMRLLDPADMNMLKWLGQWYELNRSDLSGVCHSLFGIGVYAELPNYFPVKMMLETQGLEKGNGVGWTIFPKALTPRVRNERDFDTSADIFSMWASRMEEAAQWKHHAQLGLEMRGIFGRAELREAVRANHGASVDELMQGFITDILAGHGAYDRSTAGVQYFSDQIRGWTALCALGGNVGVMAKQTTSIPAFGFEIGLVNTAKYMVNAFTPEGMAAMRRIWDSEQRRTRWQVGSSEAVRNALNQQGAGALKRMFQASMITNKLGDVVPALVVGQGIYRDCLARGMSEEDAMAETWSLVERTQQSGRMENQTSIQRRNKLGRIMFQFLSTQQQYLQYEVRAIREVIARPDSVKRWGSLGRAILLNHFILSSAYYWMGQLYKYALGQEPPEDELKDWIVTCLLGPYGSLFVAGFCCKYTLERAIKGYSIKGGSSMLPMESWIKTQINDGARLMEAIFDSEGDTWEEMLDAAGRWMGDVNSTVRDLRKIYRFRVKDEPQRR